jgi:hypothetical protein
MRLAQDRARYGCIESTAPSVSRVHGATSHWVLPCTAVQHLFATLVARPAGDLGHRLRWSLWRRRHQARARTGHYRRQAKGP